MAGRQVVRDEPRKAVKTVRHPCTVGKAKAKAAGPGKVNGAATKKATVTAAKGAARAGKAKVKARKATARTVKARVVAVRTASKTSGKVAARRKPC